MSLSALPGLGQFVIPFAFRYVFVKSKTKNLQMWADGPRTVKQCHFSSLERPQKSVPGHQLLGDCYEGNITKLHKPRIAIQFSQETSCWSTTFTHKSVDIGGIKSAEIELAGKGIRPLAIDIINNNTSK